MAMNELGPIFVKAGQVLSTRRDLIPRGHRRRAGSQLQDQVPPFPGAEARALVEQSLGQPIDRAVHALRREPAGLGLDRAGARRAAARRRRSGGQGAAPRHREAHPPRHRPAARTGRTGPALAPQRRQDPPDGRGRGDREDAGERARPAARGRQRQPAAAQFREFRRTQGPGGVLGPHHRPRADPASACTACRRTTSRPSTPPASTAARWRRWACACSTSRCSATTSSTPTRTPATSGWTWPAAEPRFIALDFGIMGSLPEADQYWLAENFIALFERDYRRIAELHLAAGWMPRHIRVDELEVGGAHGVRTVLHAAAVADLAGRGGGQAVPHRASLRADPAAAADPAAEDPAQHRGRGPHAGPGHRHLVGGAPGAQAHPARALPSAPRAARACAAACPNGCTPHRACPN